MTRLMVQVGALVMIAEGGGTLQQQLDTGSRPWRVILDTFISQGVMIRR